MSRLKVAVVGLGGNGRAFVRGYGQSERAEVVAVCDLWPERLEAAKGEFGIKRGYASLDEMLEREQPDVLSVHTSDHLHAEPFIKGIEAGCHVFVEKPMGNTMEDLERMTEAVRRCERDARGPRQKTMVGQILRFNPFFAEVHRLCAAGELGQLFYLEADYIHNLFGQADPARINPHTGGINWYLERELPIVGGGVHQLDLLRWFVGANVVEVSGFGNSIAFPAMESNDCMAALFRFETGAVAKVAALYGPVGDRPSHCSLAVYGTKGTIRDGKLYRGEGHEAQEEEIGGDIAGHPFEPQIEHFLRCIQEDQPTLVDAFEGANSAAATIQAAEAIRTGKPQQVPIFRR